MTRSQKAPGSCVPVAWRHHAGGARWLTFLLALAASLMFGVSAASAAPNITGTWTCCGTTSTGTTQAGAQVFAITESDSGALSGSGLTPTGSVFSTITGSVSGSTATIVTTYNMNDDPGYVATFTGTISADGSTMSGSWSSTFNGQATGQEGTWTATLTSKRPSATQVICNYDVATGTDTCGANVADAGAPPTITPTGQVNFTSNFGGTFLGDSCTLTPTPDSPGVASCTVQFLPPSTQPVIPPGGVSATYAGDAQHAGSSGATQLLGTIPTTAADNFPPDAGCTASASSAESDTARAHLLPHSTEGKGCGLLVATGGAGVIVGSSSLYGAFGAILGLSGPVGWTVLGIGTVIVGGAIASKSDPVDLSYRALALPPAAPKLKPRLRACVAGARGSNCRLLQRGLNSFLTAQLQIFPSVVAEAIATNRGLNAIKAKDSAAVALQTAAEKVYYGQLAATESTLSLSARALAQVLRRTHQDETVRTASIVNGLRKLTPQLAPLMFKLLAGLNESQKTIRQQLGSIPGRVSASLISMPPSIRLSQLLQLLGVHLDVAAFTQIYKSMTVENVRVLVYGLARSQTISAGNADELLSDLSCSSGRPNIARFRSDARKLVPSKYAALLKFAAAPLAGATSCT
ncbi:MAG: hypothetical protein ACLP8S_32115 [Solirubrobacteraceae bacterium]